jgi:hypothetical protein
MHVNNAQGTHCYGVHGKRGCAKAPQCYAVRTLSILSLEPSVHLYEVIN